MNNVNFNSLGTVIVSNEIFKHLDLNELCKVARVCKKWKEWADSDAAWKTQLENHFGFFDFFARSSVRFKEIFFLYESYNISKVSSYSSMGQNNELEWS